MAFYRKSVSSPKPKKPWSLKLPKFKKERWLGIFKILLVLAVTLGALGFFTFAIFAAWISRDLPDPNTLSTRIVPQSTKIYDRTGIHLLYEVHGDEKRTLIKIQDIPIDLQHATVAIEDKKFYEHHGVYWKGLVRALLLSVWRQQRVRGTSTLTQQLVKNAILTNERTLLRKVKEFLLALQIERQYTKDQILQLYFNEIPYGSTIYGIESAAETFFGKKARDLALDESALLAAIPQAPDMYSPYGTGLRGDNRDKLVGRQRYILDLMAEQGYITKEQAENAKQIETLKKIIPKKIRDISAPHFVMYVKALLEEKYGQKTVGQGGLKVITTLDRDKQNIAETQVKKGVDERGAKYGFTNAALVSLDPKSGQILAMVGSKDFFDDQHDGQVNVTLRSRQPGSSFKPIVYAVGFMRGYLPETQLWDVNTTFKTDQRDYAPRNYDLKERGPISIREALQGSLNIPAVKMLYLVGVGRVLDFAQSLGYTTLDDRSRFGLSLVLGGAEVKPLEHAAAYAAFANEGTSYPTAAILRVEDADGRLMEEWRQPIGTSVLDQSTARLVSDVLSDNRARTYVFGANNSLTLPDRPVAVKTGTTNDYHDAWTAGYTPNLTTVVWVGNNNNAEMKRGADGSVVAAPIWQAYMREATKGLPIQKFNPPAPPSTDKPALLGQVTRQTIKIDKISGYRATEFTPPDLIVDGTFYETHSILHYVDKDDPTGPPPTNPASDPQYANWEAAAQDWVQRAQWHTTNTIPVLFDDIHTSASQPQVSIASPQSNQTVDSRTLNISAIATGERPIVRLEAIVDDVMVGSSESQPFNFQATVPNSIMPGFHDLTIIAIDSVGNKGTAKITFNLTAQALAGSGITLVSPTNDTAWSRASFPKSIDLNLDNPSLYRKVDIFFVGDDGLKLAISSEVLPSTRTLRINVPAGPAVGRYQILIEGYYQNSEAHDEAKVFVNVTE